MTPEAKNLIERLLDPNPKTRLGYNGVHEIKFHPWFKGYKFNTNGPLIDLILLLLL